MTRCSPSAKCRWVDSLLSCLSLTSKCSWVDSLLSAPSSAPPLLLLLLLAFLGTAGASCPSLSTPSTSSAAAWLILTAASLGQVDAAVPLTVSGNLNPELNGVWEPRCDKVNGKASWAKGSYFLYWAITPWGDRWIFDSDFDTSSSYSYIDSSSGSASGRIKLTSAVPESL